VAAVSVELLPDGPAAGVLAAIEAADAAGLDTAFLVDEIYHRDAWMLLATAAARTRRIRLAAGVAHVTLRDPLLVAQLLATLDVVSGVPARGRREGGGADRSRRPRAMI
jgi:5,10-methylenetetrahydromethanopterin reductase